MPNEYREPNNASEVAAAAEQVRAVRWKLICSIHATAPQKRRALGEWHRAWCAHMQSLHPHWPLENIHEMLLLTEGSAQEVDEQWMVFAAAAPVHTHIVNGINRDYLKFLTHLHTRHQQRIAAGHRDESAEDRDRRERLEQNEVWRRVGRNRGLP